MIPKYKVWVAGLLPLAILMYMAEINMLGVDIHKALVWETGVWAVNFLVLGYYATPISRLTRWFTLTQMRRELGLLAFVYATVHLVFWAVFLLGSFDTLFVELIKKPFIFFGFLAWCMLVPLAITSTNKWQKKLKKTWGRLHLLVHPIIILTMMHWIWQIRSDFSWQLAYGCVFFLAFAWRAPDLYRSFRTYLAEPKKKHRNVFNLIELSKYRHLFEKKRR